MSVEIPEDYKPGQHPAFKIFGLGLGKTGTLSLTHAMRILGYTAHHSPKEIADVQKYDFINDIYVAPKYRFLEYLLPNAKFICCIRERESWHRSNERWSRRRGLGSIRAKENRFNLYGCFTYEFEKFDIAYRSYYAGVREFFADKQDKYMEINICAGEGWEKLCPFLGKEIPDEQFPVAHQQFPINNS